MVTTESPPEQRMVLYNVSWETYERLLHDYEQSSSPLALLQGVAKQDVATWLRRAQAWARGLAETGEQRSQQ